MSDFEEDGPGQAKERARKLAAMQARRNRIIELLGFRRPCGLPLSDVAIAVRCGADCLPSEVARIRREVQQEENKS